MGLNTALTSKLNGRQRVYQAFFSFIQNLPHTQIHNEGFHDRSSLHRCCFSRSLGIFWLWTWLWIRIPIWRIRIWQIRTLSRQAICDAEAEPHLGYYGYPYAYGYYPYAFHHVAKVAPLAKAGVAGHPTGTSFVARSPQGLRGKRSAEPWGYGYPYGFYGHPYVYGPGIAGHPGAATSYVARSPQGLGK